MSLLAKYVKTAGTIAEKMNASVEKTANIASLFSNAVEDQAARFATYSDSSLEDTSRADEIARAERAAKLTEHGIDPMVIKERKMQLTISKVLKDVNKSIKNLSDGLVYQAERFKIASEEALKQTIEESMRSEAELKESDAAQAISTLAAAKRAKLAALEELAEVEAQAQAKGIDLTYDPFASLKQR